ncbi:MAG: Ger(x)C family spore germination protein [Cohnella sp.]|nr:Ger(x)C family spore germination protein [Cohnella sp.]
MDRKKIAGLAAAAMAMLSLTGCWDSYDLENNRYVSALGIDYVDNKYNLFAQLLDFSYIAKQEKGKSDTPPITYIGKGQGPTVDLAANNLYPTSQQKVLWSHITSIVVTEAALKASNVGLEDFYDRFHETRYTQWIFGTQGDIEPLFRRPDFFNMSTLTTILHEPENAHRQQSWIAPIRWLQFFADYLEPGKTIVMPTLAVNRDQWKKNKDPQPMLQVSGAFLIGDKKYKGWLSNDQLVGLRWMQSKTKRTPVPIMDEGQVIGVFSLEDPKQKISETFVDGEPRYRIQVSVKGNTREMLDGATETKLQQILKKTIEQEIRKTFNAARALNADVYQLGYHTYVHHYSQWKRLKREGAFRLSDESLASVDANIHIMHSGALRDYPLE